MDLFPITPVRACYKLMPALWGCLRSKGAPHKVTGLKVHGLQVRMELNDSATSALRMLLW